MKQVCALCMVLAMLLALAGCDIQVNPPAPTETPAITETPTTAATTVQTEPASALSVFRTHMTQTMMAIADFGFPELSEEFEIMDYLLDEFPNWMGEHDFIESIPEERIVRTCDYDAWGNLLCIVPKDPNAIIRVVLMPESSEEKEVFCSKNGEPILLLADITEESPVCVSVTDSNGNTASYLPYWEYLEEEKFVDTVLDFSPESEKSPYENALEYGWIVPDESFRKDHFWSSDYGYLIELDYEPDELYDGWVWIYRNDGYGVFAYWYVGNWRYTNGKLYLKMENVDLVSPVIEGEFPVLTDPNGFGWVEIFTTEDGVGLPWFDEYTKWDDLMPTPEDGISAYDYAISQGWRLPELEELLDTSWNSYLGYALDLMDDSVPGDNGGWATVYDVNDAGAYTASYSGSWQYAEGYLHLSLVPIGNGYLVDDSFPVLMLDGQLWIGRNDSDLGLPHFTDDTIEDVLIQPKG